MDVNSIKIIGTAIAIGMGTIMPALAIGWIGSKSVDAIGRNPEAASKVQTEKFIDVKDKFQIPKSKLQ